MFRRCAIIVSCVWLCGCEPPAGAYDPKPPVTQVPPPPEKPVPPSPPPLIAGPSATLGDAPTTRVPAKSSGSGLDQYNVLNPLSALKSRDAVQQQLIYDAQIPKAMQIFEGVRNRKPTSHQEFMTEIIQKNGISLPTLPPHHRYIYDVERGELMIEMPQVAD